jgi:hypothetical protein
VIAPLDDESAGRERYAIGAPSVPRGEMTPSELSKSAEQIISELTGLPLNKPGPHQQRIPGSGPGGYRIPDFPVRGPHGSVRKFGAVIEVKASTGTRFGQLSGRSRHQLLDYVKLVQRPRDKATLVKDPVVRELLQNAHVRFHTDLPMPKSGPFAELIEQDVLHWKAIPWPISEPRTAIEPYPSVKEPTSTVGKPSLGVLENVALGIMISLAEANVASEAYKHSHAALKSLLDQITQNRDATESESHDITKKLADIANMKQSSAGFSWEFITYGQGSVPERQAQAMQILAFELADKYGYRNVRTWGDFIHGRYGHYERKSTN